MTVIPMNRISVVDDKTRRSLLYKTAAERLDMVAVCMVGYCQPVPVRIGDNTTRWPVKIVTSREPKTAAKRADLDQPLHEMVTLEWVWVDSDAHARRLKNALDELLLGADPEMVVLRHSWRDIGEEPEVKWAVLLSEAQRMIEARGETIQVVDDLGRDRLIMAEATRMVRR